MSNKFELFEDCFKAQLSRKYARKGRRGSFLCVWMELCRDTVFQNCLTQTAWCLKKINDSELLLNILNTGIS